MNKVRTDRYSAIFHRVRAVESDDEASGGSLHNQAVLN